MRISDIISRLFPTGTDGFEAFVEAPIAIFGDKVPARPRCPTWPPDLFAVAGTIIDRTGCYTNASPDRTNKDVHKAFLLGISELVVRWGADVLMPPKEVCLLWDELVDMHGAKTLDEFANDELACKCVLTLFAIADQACLGMGWGYDDDDKVVTTFAKVALVYLTGDEPSPLMPFLTRSLCGKVPPDEAVVLPKSITSSVGCTIRSLSHHLALLPSTNTVETSWNLPDARHLEQGQEKAGDPYDVRLLLIPFPFNVPARSFKLTSPRTSFDGGKHSWPAYFGLEQPWLYTDDGPLSGSDLARDLVLPLIAEAELESGARPHGIVFPECALNERVATELVKALKDSGIEFLIAGVLSDVDGKRTNRACTFVIRPEEEDVQTMAQNKHHRWRLSRSQTDRYALNFDPDHGNDQWWEDIDVSRRTLPFFGLRKDMAFVTLICEDLARTDPAMPAIRAVGPNLVVALLMDGPQLATRWPGKYAMVLAEDPGSAVLTLTCAGMVERANWVESRPAHSIGLWRDADGKTQELGLPVGGRGVLLTLQSKKKHQSTLDLRSDGELSRQLVLRTIVPLFLAEQLPKV